MPYDLYGNYYKSSRDAMNAEMAQMADIDRGIQQDKNRNIESMIHRLAQSIQRLEDETIFHKTVNRKLTKMRH